VNDGLINMGIDTLNDLVKNGWIEEVNDRIGLKRSGYCPTQWVAKSDDSNISDQEITLMEQAINGELFPKEDMKDFLYQHTPKNRNEVKENFNDWLKDRQNK